MSTCAKDQNQKLAKKAKQSLKELGYDVSLGHCYELISKMADYPNWDTAVAADVVLLSKPIQETPAERAFCFKPRTPEQLQKDVNAIVKEFMDEEGENGKSIANRMISNLIKNVARVDMFVLFDSLGCYDRDPELDAVYILASVCWSEQAKNYNGGGGGNKEAEKLLSDTFIRGFDKQAYYEIFHKLKINLGAADMLDHN